MRHESRTVTYTREYTEGLTLKVQATEYGTYEPGGWDEPGGFDVDRVTLDRAELHAFGKVTNLLEGMPAGTKDAFAWLEKANPEAHGEIDYVIQEPAGKNITTSEHWDRPEVDYEDAA